MDTLTHSLKHPTWASQSIRVEKDIYIERERRHKLAFSYLQEDGDWEKPQDNAKKDIINLKKILSKGCWMIQRNQLHYYMWATKSYKM